jgi:hypothetical protein
VTGRSELFKGMARVDASRPTHPRRGCRLETSGGLFSQQASPGFIELWSLQSRRPTLARARRGGKKAMSRKAIGFLV